MLEKKPKIFIGSSVKGLDLARAVKANLEYVAHTSVWEHVFGLSKTTIEILTTKLREFDYGVFIFSPDDEIDMNEKHFVVSRDNVIFEAGLFMGIHKSDKCFIITPRGVPNYHTLTDLDGFTTGTYDVEFANEDPTNALGTASNQIRTAIRIASGFVHPKATSQFLDLEPRVTFYEAKGINYPLKFKIILTNISGESLTIKNLEFNPGRGVTLAAKWGENINPSTAKPMISLYSEKEDNKWKEDRKWEVTVQAGEQAFLWIAFDKESKGRLEQLVKEKKAGILKLTLVHVNSKKEENMKLEI